MARQAKGFPADSFFKVPNVMLGDKKNPGWIRQIRAKGFAVYALIAMRYNHKTGVAPYTSHQTLAKILGISKTTLEAYLVSLLEYELIEKIPAGKRRRTTWTYRPKMPVPVLSSDDDEGGNRPMSDPTEDSDSPITGLKEPLNRPVSEGNRPMLSLNSPEYGEDTKSDTAESRSHTRLYTRLKEYKSAEEKVGYVSDHLENVSLSTQVQTAWEYWSHLWEAHYETPYSPARSPNPKVFAKDKKNLRDKIKAVGFVVLIERMRRCFEVCDKRFPCFINGRWQRPIGLNDFVSNHFFDQWIAIKQTHINRSPTSPSEKLQATLKTRDPIKKPPVATDGSGGDAPCGDD